MRITELFDNGEFVVSAEVGPPKGIHIDGMVEEAKKYLQKVNFVNVTDNQSSVMRLGSLATCKVLKDAGMTPIFQLTCRDRNRIALQSDLLSAAMLGIDNILCLTGDHTKLGDHPQAKPVFDLDSVSLLHAASVLESGKDLGGNELVGEPPKFAKGAVVSPCSDSVDAQLVKMERKVMAGAEYFQTQAVFEPLVTAPQVSVSSRVVYILRRLIAGGAARMSQLFARSQSRSTNVATFLALLELVRGGRVTLGPKGELTMQRGRLPRERAKEEE